MLFGVSKSAADSIIGQLGALLALQPCKRFAKGTVLMVDGTVVPTCGHFVAGQSKNYGYCTVHQVVIDADTRPHPRGRPPRDTRHYSCGWGEYGAKAAVGNATTIAYGGYQGTGLVIPRSRSELASSTYLSL